MLPRRFDQARPFLTLGIILLAWAFLRAVHAAGFAAPYYGVEIISESFRKQPLEVMARTSYDSTMRSVAQAFA